MYQIYPRSFNDSNGDGIGDLRGIIEKLDYLQSLGIDLIWLGPVYKTPNDDNGYDIADYYSIDPEFGTMDDFNDLLAGLKQRGIKLIMDLVVNHTSDEHPWFEESRKTLDNPYRKFYFWKEGKNDGPPNNWKAFFGGSAWELDPLTGEYYLHLFTKKQPDLNWENPTVRKEVYRIMKYWLDKGIDGFRLDVISLISKRLDFSDAKSDQLMDIVYDIYANGPRIHEFLQEMNREVLSQYNVMTVGEGPGITSDMANDYIGEDRGELNMIFQLDLMFLDNGPGGKFDVQPVSLPDFKKTFRKWDEAVGNRGWNNIFLDNHDFPRMVSRFGNDSEYRIKSSKLLLTFLLTMRGTPCIYMGSEIGMTNVAFQDPEDYRDVETLQYFKKTIKEGSNMDFALEQVHIQGRDNARTPMQWDNTDQAGFSSGKPWIKINPNYRDINVDQSENDENSILNYFRKMVRLRKSGLIPITGDFTELYPDDPALYCYVRDNGKESILVCLNFSDHTVMMPGVPVKLQYIFGNYPQTDSMELLPWEARIYAITLL